MYVSWRVSVRPSGAGLGNMSGQECTFSYMYTCIGYKLPTFGEYMLVGGFLCALRAQGWGICLVRNVHFLICILGNFPPDKFQIGQFPLGQVPDRTSSTAGNLSGGNMSASLCAKCAQCTSTGCFTSWLMVSMASHTQISVCTHTQEEVAAKKLRLKVSKPHQTPGRICFSIAGAGRLSSQV